MHLDVGVADPDRVAELVTRHGATLLLEANGPRTFADPARHLFCLCANGE